MLASGPPRARIARSSSGRGAHPAASTSAARIAATLPFDVAAGRDSSSLGASVPLGLPVAVLCAACLAACMRTAAPPPAPTTPKDVRVVELENGFVPVRLEAPLVPAGPKPAVISLLGENDTILAAGMVVVTFRLNWELLKGLRPPPEPAASPAPKNTVGRGSSPPPRPRRSARDTSASSPPTPTR